VHTFVIVTTADPRRIGLSYKVEMPDWGVNTWYEENPDLKAKRHFAAVEVPNTTVTWIKPDGSVKIETFAFTMEDLNALLQKADYEYDNYDANVGRKQGRPEKKVLVMTTSKERRTGSLVARTGY
jgi:hypothetical protein